MTQRKQQTAAPESEQRRRAMAVAAEAQADELSRGLEMLGELPPHTVVRPAESGLVMVRGRIGGDGAPFNLGEAVVTRMAIQLASGELGISYSLGRDVVRAKLAALCDALWQSDAYRERIERDVLVPVRARLEGERATARAQTAATRVEFFTMVRGEDAA